MLCFLSFLQTVSLPHLLLSEQEKGHASNHLCLSQRVFLDVKDPLLADENQRVPFQGLFLKPFYFSSMTLCQKKYAETNVGY